MLGLAVIAFLFPINAVFAFTMVFAAYVAAGLVSLLLGLWIGWVLWTDPLVSLLSVGWAIGFGRWWCWGCGCGCGCGRGGGAGVN